MAGVITDAGNIIMSGSVKQQRWLALVLCALIALLALHLKISLYDDRPSPSSSVSVKMWVDGQKMQLRAIPNLAYHPWFLTFLIFVPAFMKCHALKIVFHIARTARQHAFQFELYLRPPPPVLC